MTAAIPVPVGLDPEANSPLELPVVALSLANTPESPATELVADSPLLAVELKVLLPVKVLFAANCGMTVLLMLSVSVPPSATDPPPDRPVPAVTVSEGCCSMALVTPPVAMLRAPLVVIGPPASPAPLPTLVTVPLPAPGKVWPIAKVMRPVLAIENPVCAGAVVPEPKRRLREPEGKAVSLPTGWACHSKDCATAAALPLL